MQGSNRQFFITGLPRSRTAWLANFFTTENCFCYHDALSFISPVNMPYQFTRHVETIVGDSDSALVIHMSIMLRLFPTAAWVFVRRPVEEAASSYWKTFGNRYPCGPQTQSECDRRFNMLEEQLDQAEGMVSNKMAVQFSRLSNENTMRAMWDFLIGDTPFNKERWRMLESMQVNIIPSKVRFAVCS